MYPPPGPELSQATVAQLDDQFFTSDPFAYIRVRILRLLSDDPPITAGPRAREFARLLGPSSAIYEQCDPRTSTLQIAVDAFALRHQVAESLLRFLHVVLHHQAGQSHWVNLVDTPTKMQDVLSENRAALDDQDDDGVGLLREALVPSRSAVSPPAAAPPLTIGAQPTRASEASVTSDEVARAFSVFVRWINYAIQLSTQRAPDLTAAHNKFKHGMGLRPQDDVLSVLMVTPPNPDGTVPLSAVKGDRALRLFDGVTTEFLSRASRRHGLEATQLAMSPIPTLVEAAAIAHTLALLFHNAAVKHFEDHAPPDGRSAPGHPGVLVDGPLPEKLRPLRPVALRFPLTTPVRPDAGQDAWMFWSNGDIQTFAFGERTTTIVVDDAHNDGPKGG
ncbi:hypothetical protein [Fodinibacter luteus]|uniref:hypothetical protein n=1 Tax=Fodinibacter luteus TaxID=552064 RepID=UPI0031E67D02